jgi:hypothetical protein
MKKFLNKGNQIQYFILHQLLKFLLRFNITVPVPLRQKVTVPTVPVPQHPLERTPIVIPHSCRRRPGLPSQFHSILWYLRLLFPLRLLKSFKKMFWTQILCFMLKQLPEVRKKKREANHLGCRGGRVRLGSLGNRVRRTRTRLLFNHRPRQAAASG